MYLGRETSCTSCTIKTPYLTFKVPLEICWYCCNFWKGQVPVPILEVVSFFVHEKKVGLESVDV